MSIYALKGRFQALLRPAVGRLHGAGATANQVTVTAALVSLVVAWVVYRHAPTHPALYALLPSWMLLRMALNAIDGMLAREFGQQSRLGAYLNELGDVVADSALFLALLGVPGVPPVLVWALVVTALLTEYAGVLGVPVGASRRYDGPMGKSDRAFVIGALGLALAPGWVGAGAAGGVLAAMSVLCAVTVWRRVAKGLDEARRAGGQNRNA